MQNGELSSNKKPPRAIALSPAPEVTSPNLDEAKALKKKALKEERQIVMAIYDSQSFESDDFAFIEDTLTSPYESYLYDF